MRFDFKKNTLANVLVGIIIGSAIIFCISFLLRNDRTRRIFLFRTFDSEKICFESRYLKKMSARSKDRDEDVSLFIEDLLLGPFTNRYKSLFSMETRLEFCFSREKTLFVGLSAEALKPGNDNRDIKGSVELLRENIVKNFTNFNKICIFIDGMQVL